MKCPLCGMEYQGACTHGLNLPGKTSTHPAKATRPLVTTPSVAEVQTQKEEAFVALVTESTDAVKSLRGGKRDGAGRKPRGARAMTNAERQRAFRERARA